MAKAAAMAVSKAAVAAAATAAASVAAMEIGCTCEQNLQTYTTESG